MKATIIDLLRHGEVQGGAAYRGRTDDPLTANGWRQMQQQTKERRWDSVISSPLQRCQKFAAQLCKHQNMPLTIDPSWREIDFGDWEGKTAEQIEFQYPQALQRYYADPVTHAPPNGENHADFSQRIEQAWQCLLYTYPEQHLLVVTHAGVIRKLFSLLLHISFQHSLQIEINHACLSRFKCYQQKTELFVQLCFHKPL